MEGPPNAVTPKRKKDAKSCIIDGCGSDDIFTPMRLYRWRVETDEQR
jgi:hypothetical protein